MSGKNSGKLTAYASFLGGFELRIGDLVMTDELNRSMKLWNLLAYLIMHRSRTIPQAEFIEMLWPDDSDGNPLSALKTLFFRVRRMLASVFGAELSLITSRYSSYAWAGDIPCVTDAEVLEQQCRRAADPRLCDDERMALYKEILALYRGDFLPKLSGQLWTISFRTHYHALFLSAAKEYAGLLSRAGRNPEAAEVCLRALQIDAYDEQLHLLLLRALLAQGKHAAAQSHYEQATDFLYRNLGVQPSQELREAYSEIMNVQKSVETDLSIIREGLGESFELGAFVCEYGFFQEAYRVFSRLSGRLGISVHMLLFTLSNRDGSAASLELLAGAMDQLLLDAKSKLRRSDIISRYSGAQYLIMLPKANYEDSLMVAERVRGAFSLHYRYRRLRLVCRVQPLEVGLPGGADQRDDIRAGTGSGCAR